MRPSATELMKHAWLKNDSHDNQTDMNNAIGEIEQYKEKLNQEIKKLQATNSTYCFFSFVCNHYSPEDEEEERSVVEKAHTLTQDMKEKLKKVKQKQKNESEELLSKHAIMASLNVDKNQVSQENISNVLGCQEINPFGL